MRFPKSLIPAFKKAVKELSGQVRRKQHTYKELHLNPSIRPYQEFAGDGNELFGAYYNVQETHKYKIVKYKNHGGENLSSSHRELLVLHRCIQDNASQNKGNDLVYYTDS